MSKTASPAAPREIPGAKTEDRGTPGESAWSGTLWPAFQDSFIRNAGSTAVVFNRRQLTYAQFHAAVLLLGRHLADRGIRAGDRVVLYTHNCIEYLVADVAILALGAVKVPISAMASTEEATAIIERVEASMTITDSTALLTATLPAPTQVLSISEIEIELPHAAAVQEKPGTPQMRAESPAVIYFTGGTTGAPKGIVHSQAGVLANLHAHIIEAEISRDEHLLLTTPLVHAAGLFALAGLLRGAKVSIESAFDADRVLEVINDRAVTWLFAVPTMINRLVNAAELHQWHPRTLRTIQYGAAPISPSLLQRALSRFGPILQQLYAQTECPDYATLLTKQDHLRALEKPRLLSSAGRSTLMCNVTVRAEDGAAVPVRDLGEICLAAPYVMTSYWRDPQGYADRFYGRWMRTGDIGYLDEDGYLYIVDRRNDMIVTGGLNVYSVDVENVLSDHPDVDGVAVIGIPDPDWGEAVCAYVVTSADEDRDLLADRILDHCRATAARYKVPKKIVFIDQLPLTRYGKVDKKALRLPHWGATGRGIN
ncbi:fatty-acyl-CoA synthase/long-chain acyl-CoA synthetase [Arthrobacter ginsengisoli]|uniref:Fatty-acyl-CoA synthase/long-chain acyl-CoA synthetase n=1 Tax=Arthrobacter ginsengisoli TaxID=1356565 RepID=A0ABU1UHP4_9MICC|nr:AMP-binding protein [Arthrobacter ginsengisoli]MDR7084719.1 fatty-acyl-CoA synthase/long-chain acyl-CoA synthetase [Arthrobacter ginsengisoli]